MRDDDDAWFAAKRYGYGSGLPIKRAGWYAMAGFLAVIALATFLLPYSLVAYAIIVGAATAAFLILTARKTRGGWHWRWGRRD
jgi:hypothetical protein